jgi:hypothetical protein
MSKSLMVISLLTLSKVPFNPVKLLSMKGLRQQKKKLWSTELLYTAYCKYLTLICIIALFPCTIVFFLTSEWCCHQLNPWAYRNSSGFVSRYPPLTNRIGCWLPFCWLCGCEKPGGGLQHAIWPKKSFPLPVERRLSNWRCGRRGLERLRFVINPFIFRFCLPTSQ